MVVDLILPGDDGIQLIEEVQRARPSSRELPIIVYTGKDLTPEDDERAEEVRAVGDPQERASQSPERLLSETALFLHRVESQLPERSKAVLEAQPPQRRVASRGGRCWSSTTTSATSSR